jgi:hypothetical protein
VASRFDRLKPLRGRAGLHCITSVALLLLVSGPPARAEDEPSARAPLPPLPRSIPAEIGERQMPDPASSRNQSAPGTSAIRFDRSKLQLSRKKPRLNSASYLGIAVAKNRATAARIVNHSMDATSRRQGHRTVASDKRQRQDRSPVAPAIGQLSPPRDYSDTRIGSTTEPTAEPPQAPPLYYPNYFAGPPAYGYAPSYPYAWSPPGPGVFR